MHNLSFLADDMIIEQTEKLVRTEREITTQILHYLREIERRRIFASCGFGSLFEFCVKKLGYSESGAHRRIQSMRLLKSLGREKAEAIEKKIEKGDLSLSVVAQAATFIQREAKSSSVPWNVTQKESLLKSLEGHSARETEKKLLSMASEESRPSRIEKIRPISDELTELRVALSSDTLAQLEKIKGLLSHKHPNASWSELIEILAQMALKNLDPARPVRTKSRKSSEGSPEAVKASVGDAEVESVDLLPTLEVHLAQSGSVRLAKQSKIGSGKAKREAIPAAVARQVWQRDQGQCQYQDSKTGKKCLSNRFLQLDHLILVADGGRNEVENLLLKCRYHNELSAIERFGHETMVQWIPSLRGW